MRRAVAALVIGLALGACGGSASPAAEASVDLVEYGIESTATAFQAGDVALQLTNAGEFPHTLVVTDEAGAVVAASEVLSTGDATSLSVALAPGEYDFTCRIVGTRDDGTVVDHFEEGMALRVSVTG